MNHSTAKRSMPTAPRKPNCLKRESACARIANAIGRCCIASMLQRLILSALVICLQTTLVGQDRSIELGNTTNRASSGQDFETKLNDLIRTTERIRQNRLQAPTTDVPAADIPTAKVPTRTGIPIAAPNQSAPIEQLRPIAKHPFAPENPLESVDEIRNRIDLLRRLRHNNAAKSQANPPPPNQQPTATATNQRITPVDPTPVPSSPDPAPLAPSTPLRPVAPSVTPKVTTQDANMMAIERNIETKKDDTIKTPAPLEPTISATQVLSDPVDAFRLGQSLFQTRNYTAALKALQSVDSDRLNVSDRTWLKLLTSLCHRRLGNIQAAEAGLRDIANAQSSDYPVSVARWWLKQTEMVGNAQPLVGDITAEMDSLIERSKTHVEN
ncbi:MAG: hypothetical protein HKN47_16865 [Pirellulaceae bacterium]|nr:hypothetical protein [Pirellulaceae bacterium]